jgi:hypothetical protein
MGVVRPPNGRKPNFSFYTLALEGGLATPIAKTSFFISFFFLFLALWPLGVAEPPPCEPKPPLEFFFFFFKKSP